MPYFFIFLNYIFPRSISSLKKKPLLFFVLIYICLCFVCASLNTQKKLITLCLILILHKKKNTLQNRFWQKKCQKKISNTPSKTSRNEQANLQGLPPVLCFPPPSLLLILATKFLSNSGRRFKLRCPAQMSKIYSIPMLKMSTSTDSKRFRPIVLPLTQQSRPSHLSLCRQLLKLRSTRLPTTTPLRYEFIWTNYFF
jgi:hypothetical protein